MKIFSMTEWKLIELKNYVYEIGYPFELLLTVPGICLDGLVFGTLHW